jgi:hypothetical protein
MSSISVTEFASFQDMCMLLLALWHTYTGVKMEGEEGQTMLGYSLLFPAISEVSALPLSESSFNWFLEH